MFHVSWQLCRGLVDYGPGQSQLFRPSLSEMTAHFFVSSLWCSPELQWLLRCSSIKTWHNETRAPSFIIFLLCTIVCFLIVGSQAETEWNLWWPWHHFGFGFGPQVIHWPSLFACELRGDVHQARHVSDVCVDLSIGLLSPALFHPLLQMQLEELTRYLLKRQFYRGRSGFEENENDIKCRVSRGIAWIPTKSSMILCSFADLYEAVPFPLWLCCRTQKEQASNPNPLKAID